MINSWPLSLAEPDTPVVDNPALTTALKASSSLTKEQKTAFSRTLEGFVSCLAPSVSDPHANPHARTIITEEAWDNRASWGRDEWNAWETWGWYRQFCRVVSPSLAMLNICAEIQIRLVLSLSPNVYEHAIRSLVCEV